MNISKKTRGTMVITVCIILYIFISVLCIVNDNNANVFTIGDLVLPFMSFNGCLQSLQFILCVVMVCFEHKRGFIASSILMPLNLVTLVRAIIMSHQLQPLPGIINLIMSYIALSVLARQFRKQDREKYSDILTGLRNRRGLVSLFDEKSGKDSSFYVIYIDLENFKYINDNLGHRCGDAALKILAKRMTDIIGRHGTLCRIGGDEFVLILSGSCDPVDISEKIIESVNAKIPLSTGETTVDCYVSAFAGISKYPDDSRDSEKLIKYADIAMYESVKTRTTRVSIFDKKMEDTLTRQMELERIIKESFDKDYFYLVYQPQYIIKDKKLRGFETLIRLKTADGTFVSPAEFIPVAEKTGLILKIDDYVLKRAMKEFKEPLEKAGNSFVVSINVSAKNIGSADFADRVKAIIDAIGFPPQCLEIEMTEYCLAQSMEITIRNIEKLRALGVQVALDDFGTGYTSLSYLANLPINLLKIDKSLIDGIESSKKSRDFVNAVVSMGHLMGCEVISEGVESEPQLDILNEYECDFVQGFVWGRPLDYEAAKELSSANL